MPLGLIPAVYANTLDGFMIEGKEGLRVLNDRPLNAETPPHLLNDDITPADKLFIRNNGIPGWQLVKIHCTRCHSARTMTQNRMDKAAWLETIRWMQKTQGLWDLADAESIILDYLAKRYGINSRDKSKRKPLSIGTS